MTTPNEGLGILGGGSILGGLILSAIAVFVIERELVKAAWFSAAGAVLTFLGFMHGESIGIGHSPVLTGSYLGIAVVFYACAKLAVFTPKAAEETSHHGPVPEPAE
jgi:AGZA family xanthine/uracil permease-like MFS transporter